MRNKILIIPLLFLFSACGTTPSETSVALDMPYSIQALQQREYHAGDITIVNEQDDGNTTAYTGFYYPSDGLNIYSRMSAPNTGGPYPVIIAIHGYSPKSKIPPPKVVA